MLHLAAVLLALAVLLGAAEWADPEAGVRPHRDSKERRRHLAWMAVYLVIAPAVGWVAARTVAVADHLAAPWALAGRLPWGVRVMVAFAVADSVAYWLHRAMHASPVLWRLHAVHHRATDVRWWTAFRFHPLDTLAAHTLPYATAALAGVGTDAVAAYLVTVVVVTLFAHADLFVPGRGLARLVVTPGFHRTHHDIGGHGRNFALVLPVADVVFGTAVFGTRPPRQFGLPPVRAERSGERHGDPERCQVGQAGGDRSGHRIVVPPVDDRRLDQ